MTSPESTVKGLLQTCGGSFHISAFSVMTDILTTTCAKLDFVVVNSGSQEPHLHSYFGCSSILQQGPSMMARQFCLLWLGDSTIVTAEPVAVESVGFGSERTSQR